MVVFSKDGGHILHGRGAGGHGRVQGVHGGNGGDVLISTHAIGGLFLVTTQGVVQHAKDSIRVLAKPARLSLGLIFGRVLFKGSVLGILRGLFDLDGAGGRGPLSSVMVKSDATAWFGVEQSGIVRDVIVFIARHFGQRVVSFQNGQSFAEEF